MGQWQDTSRCARAWTRASGPTINNPIGWHQSVIKPTLEFAKEHLGLHPGIVLRYKHSSADNSGFVKVPDVRDKVLVDHLIRPRTC